MCLKSWYVGSLPDEKPPQGPNKDESDSEYPALSDKEGDWQHDGIRIVFDHDQKLCNSDGRHNPRLLAQLFMEFPKKQMIH